MERLPKLPLDATPYDRELNRALYDWKRRDDAERDYCYVPCGTTAPSEVPPMRDGFVPLYVDTTTKTLYFYDGAAWRASAAFT